MKPRLLALMTLLAGSACRSSDPSDVKGHFESMSEKEAEALAASKPKVIEEHAQVETVAISAQLVMSEELGGFGRVDLAKSILESGSQLLILVGKDQPAKLDDPVFAELRQASSGYFKWIRFLAVEGQTSPTPWSRDWAPLQAKNEKAEKVFLDFNYYPNRASDDATAQNFARFSPDHKRLSVPVYNEGGNFMSNSRGLCLMTDRVLDANSFLNGPRFVDKNTRELILDEDGYPVHELPADKKDSAIEIRGSRYQDVQGKRHVRLDDKELDLPQVVDYYKRYAGCAEVIVLPRMPHEATGHIDMFAKFINDDTVLVNEISKQQLSLVRHPAEKAVALETSAYLEKITTRIKELGLKVLRIPMPIPQWRQDIDNKDRPEMDSYITRSYSNALLIARPGKKFALVPRYTRARVPEWLSTHLSPGKDDEQVDQTPTFGRSEVYSDHDLIEGYEKAVTKAYGAAGYRTIFIDSDNLISQGGAVHCTTMQFAHPLWKIGS